MTDDVRELLGRAFGDEPPLRIDRDEVLEQGRKRLRRRRFFEAGSVVAAVVVAAVGAATLTNLGGADPAQPERMPPAATSARPMPNEGPELPLPPESASPSEVQPPASGPTPSVSGDDLTKQLTAMLYDSGLVATKDVEVLPDESGANPVFHQYGDQYVYSAVVVRAETKGVLQVTVDHVPDTVANCGMIPRPHTDCAVWDESGQVVMARYEGTDGERRTYMTCVQPGGVRVSATATNVTAVEIKAGVPQDPKTAPVLTDDELYILVTKAGLGVY